MKTMGLIAGTVIIAACALTAAGATQEAPRRGLRRGDCPNEECRGEGQAQVRERQGRNQSAGGRGRIREQLGRGHGQGAGDRVQERKGSGQGHGGGEGRGEGKQRRLQRRDGSGENTQ